MAVSLSGLRIKDQMVRWAVWRLQKVQEVELLMLDDESPQDIDAAFKDLGTADEPKGRVIMAVKVRYVTNKEIERITEDSVSRTVTNARKALKQHLSDLDLRTKFLMRDIVKDWRLTVEALRHIKAVMNLEGLPAAETIDFNRENLDELCAVTLFPNYIENLIRTYEWWFPAEGEQEKNSVSGRNSSGGGSPATPASLAT